MDFFKKSNTVRLRSRHGKFLYADDDECEVSQNRNGSKKNALWTVEFAGNDKLAIKLKSCYGCYLTATDVPFLLGMTGKKVLQMKLVDSESSVVWIPVREGFSVKLRTRSGNYLRANGTIPPWRNSITHDVPHRSATQDWVLWEIVPEGQNTSFPISSPGNASFASNGNTSFASNGNTSFAASNGNASFANNGSPSFSLNQQDSFSSTSSLDESPSFGVSKTSPSLTPMIDGRTIYYSVADDGSRIPEDFDFEFTFEGHDVKMLIEKMKEITEIEDDIYVCAKNHFTNKLFPLTLQLPPNNSPMYLVVVKASSKLAKSLPNVQSRSEEDVNNMYSRSSSLSDDY